MEKDTNQVTFMKLREDAGLTQRQIAVSMDVTTGTVSAWERGRHEPRLTPAQMQHLLKLLNCTLDELVIAVAQASKSYTAKNN